jgi:hypothetical protein
MASRRSGIKSSICAVGPEYAVIMVISKDCSTYATVVERVSERGLTWKRIYRKLKCEFPDLYNFLD